MSAAPTLFAIDRAPQWRTADLARNRSEYARRLAAVLGNGADWEYRGICVDLQSCNGKCSCGHRGLRYLFTLHNVKDERTAIVGSTCVENYASISPAVAAALAAAADRLEAEAATRDARAAAAGDSPEVRDLMQRWSAAEYRIDQAITAWHQAHPGATWLPEAIFRRPAAAERLAERAAERLHPFCRLPSLVTPSGQAARLRQYLAEAAAELAAVHQGRATQSARGRLPFAS